MIRVIALALAIVGWSSIGRAQAPTAQAPGASPAAAGTSAATPATQDPNGVEFALGRYVVTFNKHDADALVALWTPQAVYVDKATGKRTEGREALAAEFRALFAAAPSVVLSGQIEGVRSLSPDLAMVDGTTMTVTGDGEPDAASFSAIFKRVDGKWLVDSVHEMPLPMPESPRQALEPLAWMVGHWRDQGDAGQVDTVVRWSPSDAFLIRSYRLAREGEPPFEGTQVIGWDPRAKQIRSWTFNSDGSFGEGMWSRNRGEWLVRSSQTLADGRAATATQVITQVDADTATVQTIGKEIEGLLEPAAPPITVVRVAEPPTGEPAATAGTLPTATAPASTEAQP
jgi:uncharacterized protein (TIGR02246 family)